MTDQQRAPSHICVLGVGGVGGYFGGKLAWWLAAQTDPSWQVHFVARGAHLAEINRSGLVLDTPGLRMTCDPTSAAEHLGDLPVPDIVLVCVKSYGLAEAVRQIAAHRHRDTAVIPLLNGVDIHARIRAGLRSGPVLPAGVVVGTHLERPGVVSQAGGDGVMFVGRDPDCPGFVPDSFLGLLEKAGIRHRWLDDPRPALWEKYVFISAFGLVTAAWRKSVGEVLVDARLLEDVKGIMNEVARLAAREGIALDPGVVANALARANGFPFDTRTSLQRDVEAGRRHEGDLFGGAILRMGERLGVPTPFTERVYARIPAGSCPS